VSFLLDQLRRIKGSRGLMANLRCYLVEGKRHRAWPALSRIHVRVDDEVKALVAGLYASHPEETDHGNLGTTCKALEAMRDGGAKGEDKVTPTERRFQHLLAAEAGEEVFGRVTRMVLLAKAQGVPVNYEQLALDLEPPRWKATRQKWASAFWDSHSEQTPGGTS
jgi:CRISPR system Cascade subunit CasB